MKKLEVGMHVRIKKSLPAINDNSFRGQEGVIADIFEPSYQCRYLVDLNDNYIGFARKELKILKTDWTDAEGCTHHTNGTVSIPMDWSDSEFLAWAKAAHAEDMSLNAWVAQGIMRYIRKELA